jgi:hypothetical protein
LAVGSDSLPAPRAAGQIEVIALDQIEQITGVKLKSTTFGEIFICLSDQQAALRGGAL